MIVDATNIETYLRTRGRLRPGERINTRKLPGGVSNDVYYVTSSQGDNFVLKQARGQLNVVEPWFCSVERIWREIEVLRVCHRLTTSSEMGSLLRIETPELLFEDRENHLYAMTAAPPDHVVWKNELLSGRVRADVAESCGMLLGRLHAGTWHDSDLSHKLGDRQFFDVLRLDPYYRHVAHVHADLKPALESLIESVWQECHCLVHGDFSPKNLLIYGNSLMLIDFEVGHYGDPAFDLGFFLSHLMLKAFYHAPSAASCFNLIDSFWNSYLSVMSEVASAHEIDLLVRRSILNFAGCALARLDGKSKVDYLTQKNRREQMHYLCRVVLTNPPARWDDVTEFARRSLSDRLRVL